MPAEYARSKRLFLALLGVVYVIAFASFGLQAAGLVGDDGILPASAYFTWIGDRLGPDAPWRVPSLCWLLGADTRALQAMSAVGATCGLALTAGIAAGPAALLAWLLYLSIVAAGQVFLGFQWDALLLEAGLLALLVAPWRWRARRLSPSVVPLLPLWALVVKLHVMSGWVKLASGDPTWRSLTALEYHYWTTCLPVWVGWYAAQLPPWVQRASVVIMFAVELVAPLAVFGPRRLRHLAAFAMIALQAAIAATGNYGFFNLLTVALCLTLFDDAALARVMPRAPREGTSPPGPLTRALAGGMAAALIACSLTPMAAAMAGPAAVPRPLTRFVDALAPLRAFNGYGLFARMTTVRPEIVIEASDDGRTWHAYEFRWKPGALDRRPEFVQPYMPRLDWQMWFAALQGAERTYWFRPFLARLRTATPSVLALLAPQAGAPTAPRHVRATLYHYEFATPSERAQGLWWHRRLAGPYATGPDDPLLR